MKMRFQQAGFAIALSLIFLVPARAEDVPGVNDCDVQAANPIDPQRMTKGVVFNDMVPRLAVLACEKAVGQFPGEARFQYQLGRAYSSSARDADAKASFEKAAAAAYPIAFYNAGSLAENSRDYEKAREYYKRASSLGIKGASDALARLDFNPSGYSNPELFKMIYNGDIEELDAATSKALTVYMSEFLLMFSNTSQCTQAVPAGVAIKVQQVAKLAALGQIFGAMSAAQKQNTPGDFEGAAVGGYKAGQDLSLSLATQVGSARSDAQLFYDRHTCSGPIAEQFFAHIAAWAGKL